jgi:hypothetical protein
MLSVRFSAPSTLFIAPMTALDSPTRKCARLGCDERFALDTTKTGDKFTIVVERAPEGKIKATSLAWGRAEDSAQERNHAGADKGGVLFVTR